MTTEPGGNAALTSPGTDETVRIEIEQPQPGDVVHPGDSLLGFGWVLADSRVRDIVVAMDGEVLGHAVTGLSRTDVAEEFADHPGASRAGFTFVARIPPSATSTAPGLMLTVRTDDGTSEHIVPLIFIGPVRSAATPPPPPAPAPVTAAPRQAAPAGDMDPIRLEPEEARLDANLNLMVRGWAVTALTTQSIEILVGGVSLGFADTMLSREDVGAAFPLYPNAAQSGFLLKCQLPQALAQETEAYVVVTDTTGLSATGVIDLTGPGIAAPAASPAEVPALAPLQAFLEEARVTELGILRVRGWAVSLSPVQNVRVYLDEALIGMAAHRQPRDDVAVAHPHYPDAGLGGFLLQQDMPDGPMEGRTIRVNVTALGGIRRDLVAPLTVAPVIKRRERAANAVEFHCDGIELSEDGALHIHGWAVCASGVSEIEVDVGEDALGLAELGGERPDVGNHFPQFANARNGGFNFAGRVPHRCEGEYIARITVRGRNGEHRVVQQPVLATPNAGAAAAALPEVVSNGDRGIRYFLDTPAIKDGRATEIVRGFLSLGGWAFSADGVNSIEVFVDGRSQGQAYRGIRREDLHTHFGRKEALRSGFAMMVPPQVMKRGLHDVRVVITDAGGMREEVAFSLEAEPSLTGPGPWSLRNKVTQAELDLQTSILTASGYLPRYALMMLPGSAAAAQAKRLRTTLESLRHQAYDNWHLLVPVANAGETAAVDEILATLPEIAERVRCAKVTASTLLADLAPQDGEGLLCLLSPGDQLGEDALLELSVEGAVQRAPDFIYSDERRVDPADGMARAFFKPDWSPDLLLSTNYIGRIWAARAELLRATGAVFGDLAKHGEYDLVLRLTEQTSRIAHVAKVLASRGPRGLDAPAAERRALARALERRGIEGTVEAGYVPGSYHVTRKITQPGLVSIIIPTIASRGLVEIAVASIRAHTPRAQHEIILLDNIRDASTPEAARWKAWFREHADQTIDIDEKFNWSRFNNIGARHARGDYLLFLNDDIEILQDGWLDGLLEHAQRPEVGAVGPQLLYPGGTVQHAGMFLAGSVGRHAFRFSPPDEPGPFGLARTLRNVISVTGACMLMHREAFDAIGGFDEEHSVINNDLDFCLRLRESGRTVLYTPFVTLTHHEMVSRGELRDVFNAAHFTTRWRDLFLAGDPYFNPNLAQDVDDYVPEQEPFKLVHVGHPVVSRSKVRRILAMKVDHIGDFISAFPAFRRIKEKFPNAELTVLAASASLSLAALEPCIDRVIKFDFFHVKSERGRRAMAKKELQALEQELAPLEFDLAVDLRRQPDTRHILQHTGARWLAGFDKENRTEWLDIAVEWEGDTARTNKRTHISDALVQFVDAVAVACEDERRVIHAVANADAARDALRELPALQDITPALLSRRLICMHLGAGAENKRWPAASFAGLADLLVASEDANIVVIGGPDEAELFAEMSRSVRHQDRLFSVAGKLSLRHLPLLLRCADLYVGNDSGPKHMASALGVATIGIHSGSVDAVEWGPMGPAAFGVRRVTTCSPCYLAKAADCPRNLLCLHGIRVADVYQACRRMMTLSRQVQRTFALEGHEKTA